MTLLRWLAPIVLVLGCGRIGFDRFGDAGEPIDTGGPIDAREVPDSPVPSCATDDDCDRCERCEEMRCQAATFVELGLGYSNACARDERGDVWCWGRNEYAIQGTDGSVPIYRRPRRIGLGGTIEISIGRGIALARDDSGTLWGWGYSTTLGDGIHPLDSARSWAAIRAAYFNGCALTTGGALYCAGDNTAGQLARGTSMPDQQLPLAPFSPDNDWADIAPFTAMCARKQDDRLFCVGSNTFGQTGVGSTVTPQLALLEVGAGGWAAVSTGHGHTCAIRSDRTLFCWGSGQTNGLGTDVSVPTQVDPSPGWTWVGADYLYACAMRGGALYCWGEGHVLTTTGGVVRTPRPMPIALDPGTVPVIGGDHACALVGGEWMCWGSNEYGQLGLEASVTASGPVPLCP